jgi:uncharacterized repeat protein (TIGR03803 family)
MQNAVWNDHQIIPAYLRRMWYFNGRAELAFRIEGRSNKMQIVRLWISALALAGLVPAAAVVARAQTYSVLYGFTGTTDGAHPDAGLIRDSVGNLYGTTQAGGVSGCTGCGFGIVFKLDPAGNLTVLHTFTNGMKSSGRVRGFRLPRQAVG